MSRRLSNLLHRLMCLSLAVASIAWVSSARAEQRANKASASFEWTGPAIDYPPPSRGDTFPMTWADDDEIYTSAGDPGWGNKQDGLDFEKFSGMPPDYRITRVNPMVDFTGFGGQGQKPTGMICVKGVLYLAYQNLLGKKPPLYGNRSQHGDDAVIAASSDHGQTWVQTPMTTKVPMFPGANFGGPAFINFGRNNANAVDNYVYAISSDQWDNGSHLRLGRVPSDKILEAAAWEWVSSVDANKNEAHWTKQSSEAQPVFSEERSVGAPEMVYVASIKRYLLLNWKLKADFSSVAGSELSIYESPQPWGPFTLIHHEDEWESKDMNSYCPRLALKWLKVSGDEITGWLQFSGSWRRGSPNYRSHVRPFRIRLK